MEILVFMGVVWLIIKYSQASETKKKEYKAKLQAAYERVRVEAQKNSRNAHNFPSKPSPAPAQKSQQDFQYDRKYEQLRHEEQKQRHRAERYHQEEPQTKIHNNSQYILHRNNHEKCVRRNNDNPTIVRPRRFWGNADLD